MLRYITLHFMLRYATCTFVVLNKNKINYNHCTQIENFTLKITNVTPSHFNNDKDSCTTLNPI